MDELASATLLRGLISPHQAFIEQLAASIGKTPAVVLAQMIAPNEASERYARSLHPRVTVVEGGRIKVLTIYNDSAGFPFRELNKLDFSLVSDVEEVALYRVDGTVDADDGYVAYVDLSPVTALKRFSGTTISAWPIAFNLAGSSQLEELGQVNDLVRLRTSVVVRKSAKQKLTGKLRKGVVAMPDDPKARHAWVCGLDFDDGDSLLAARAVADLDDTWAATALALFWMLAPEHYYASELGNGLQTETLLRIEQRYLARRYAAAKLAFDPSNDQVIVGGGHDWLADLSENLQRPIPPALRSPSY